MQQKLRTKEVQWTNKQEHEKNKWIIDAGWLKQDIFGYIIIWRMTAILKLYQINHKLSENRTKKRPAQPSSNGD